MKTIHQLAKMARREKRKHGYNAYFLASELERRNINGPAKRDTETPAVKANRLFFEGLRAAIAKRDAAR